MTCRTPRDIPYMLIVVGRVSDPTSCPGPDALTKQCSICEEKVWVAPRTVIDTGLRPPLVCKQCYAEVGKVVREMIDAERN